MGEETYQNDKLVSHYKGPYVNNHKSGLNGVITFTNGSVYTGSFANDLCNGRGKMVFAAE